MDAIKFSATRVQRCLLLGQSIKSSLYWRLELRRRGFFEKFLDPWILDPAQLTQLVTLRDVELLRGDLS